MVDGQSIVTKLKQYLSKSRRVKACWCQLSCH